ncbi:hypothetical protein PR048_015561 [Dryococelus australis]|uniref:Uncharacterized protein n=1 Tax=Dryococelus australis TaxID=614101 RepID=A0ABQ9HH88_9NEOP|nr:hypothetical protein PR048_015561 [Dryococelus australis]
MGCGGEMEGGCGLESWRTRHHQQRVARPSLLLAGLCSINNASSGGSRPFGSSRRWRTAREIFTVRTARLAVRVRRQGRAAVEMSQSVVVPQYGCVGVRRYGSGAADLSFTSIPHTSRGLIGAAVAKWLRRSPPTTAIRARSPAGSLPDSRMWESCWTMPLVGELPRGTPAFPALALQRRFILGSHLLSCPSVGECCLAPGSLPTRASWAHIQEDRGSIPDPAILIFDYFTESFQTFWDGSTANFLPPFLSRQTTCSFCNDYAVDYTLSFSNGRVK